MRTLAIGGWIGVLAVALASGCFSSNRQERAASFLDDKVTRDRIQAALQRAPSNRLAGVQVSVTNGTAYLTGTVSTAAEREEALRLAQGTQRVQKVQDALQVQRQAGH